MSVCPLSSAKGWSLAQLISHRYTLLSPHPLVRIPPPRIVKKKVRAGSVLHLALHIAHCAPEYSHRLAQVRALPKGEREAGVLGWRARVETNHAAPPSLALTTCAHRVDKD
jgi:hypothetical protein